jgi:class 3 adenylate cyclase/tetratricopeptide (TPR) repeat protein
VQRKTVTILFCDVTGSTALGESVDPEALRELLARYFERMKTIVESHGGTVEKFIGDAVMAVFGVPVAYEDDALRAVRAAAEMREAMPELGVQARIGVNTGEVVTGTEERLVTGDAVNVAARLQQAAQPGEVLIGEPTLALVRDAIEVERVEPLALKGKVAAVAAHRLARVREAPERRHRSRFVGRARELSLLREAWERAQDEQRCELVTLVGDAGVGKSRLIAEFLRELEGTVVRGRSLPYGDGITYWPVVEVLKQLGVRPPEEAAAAAIRTLLGETDAETSAEEIAWAFRKTLDHSAAERPLVVVFDDIQWADETFLDLIEHVALLSSGATILVLCMARRELTERRSTWPVTFRLQPLADEDVEDLIPKRIASELREKIARAAGGNPLFIEEMVAMAGEADGGVVVSPTLQALLAARLDQLDPRERSVLECAAVEGEIFHRGAVQALARDEPQVTPQLAALVRKELIRPDTPQLPGEDGFRFRHLLIRDAAYDGLPKTTRADLHERFASWLDMHARLVEQDEIVGYHLEQAARYRDELGSPDPRLAEAAAARLGAAARSALARGNWTASRILSRRVLDLVPEAHPLRLDVLPTYVFAFWDVEGGRLAQEAIDELRRSQEERAVQFGSMLAADLRIFQGGGGSAEELERASEHARPIFERLGDEAGLAYAYYLIGLSKWVRGWTVDMAAACERALVHARRANAVRVENECRGLLASAQLFGPIPVSDAIEYCESRLRDFSQHAPVRGDLKTRLASLYAMRGEIEKGRDVVRASREFWREAGVEAVAAASRMVEARVEWYAGDLGRAEELARVGLAELEELEDRGFAGTMALFLASYLEEQGKLEEAQVVLRHARQLTNPAEVFDVVGLDAIEARLLARRGRFDDAEQLARRAHVAASSTDLYFARVLAASSLALVLELAGRTAEAQKEFEYALGVAEAKGDTVYASRLRARLDEVAALVRL